MSEMPMAPQPGAAEPCDYPDAFASALPEIHDAAPMSGKDYVVRITPGAARAGKSYTIEIRGHAIGR